MGDFITRLDDVLPDSGQDQFVERRRMFDRSTKQRHCSEREADGVDRTITDGLQNTSRQVGVVVRVVGARCRAVPEKIDADHLAADVGEEIDQARRTPGGLVRTSPTVHQDDRTVHHGGQPTP